MKAIEKVLTNDKRNFVFFGEAGAGKSEIAINFANYLLNKKDRPVHFFDMDMTKPLFRSRDLCNELEKKGIVFHYEEQFMDAPTLVGGVNRLFGNDECYVVMDVGGDYIGARSVGGFANSLLQNSTVVYYVLNVYRPWSYDITHIDKVLGEILNVTHLNIEKIRLLNNSNLGIDSTASEILKGYKRLSNIIAPYAEIDFSCVNEKLYKEVKEQLDEEILPLHLYFKYPWENQLVNYGKPL